jgi:hypothetical protein
VIWLILLFSAFPIFSQAADKDCSERLVAFTAWELEIGGKATKRVNTSEIPHWDPDSVYDGIALSGVDAKYIKKPSLEIEYQAEGKNAGGKSAVFKKTAALPADASLLQFTEFNPREFFTFEKPGKYEVRLKDADSLICKSVHEYSP